MGPVDVNAGSGAIERHELGLNMTSWSEGKPTPNDQLCKNGKTLWGGSSRTVRSVLAVSLAVSSLLTVIPTGVDAQAAMPTPTASPTAAAAPASAASPTGNDSSVHSPTSTNSQVTSPTNTSTEATTTGNVTVTGGAGPGANTTVTIYGQPGATGAAGAPGAPGAAASSSGVVGATGATAPPGTVCEYKLGFALLHNLIPAVMGDCLTDERHNGENGDGLQNSASGGLLVWRKADNWTAFTDGYRTWINGPSGIQQRLNTQRYSWEANPEGLPAA